MVSMVRLLDDSGGGLPPSSAPPSKIIASKEQGPAGVCDSAFRDVSPTRNRTFLRQKRHYDTETSGRARSSKKTRCLIPLSETEAESRQVPPVRNVNILELPHDVLIKIFGCLDLKLHRFILPLVCRQWHDILSKPLCIWNHLDIDFTAESQQIVPGKFTKNSNKVRESRVLQWVKPRAAAVKSLRLRGRGDAGVDIDSYRLSNGQKMHDFTGSGVAKLLLTVQDQLQELAIECCYDVLTDITFLSMGHLSHLVVLCLKGIMTMMSDRDFIAIASLENLQELVLDCEEPPDVENGVEEIKWGLQSFPEGMLHLTNMTHLTLTCHYGITELPSGLSTLNKLEVLNMDFCTLKALPASLGQLTTLTTLDVEGNVHLGSDYATGDPSTALQSIPPSFPLELSGLRALRYLNLNSCGLTVVPTALSGMIALETLDLENNELGSTRDPEAGMHAVLNTLTSLQCLNLTKNQLVRLPEMVMKFTSLRILDVTNNNLTNDGIPSSLSQLGRLKAIGLKKNKLEFIPPILGKLHDLQELYLENNPSLEVRKKLDYLVNLPNLRLIMMGKQSGGWENMSLAFITDLAMRLKLKHPEREILRISFPGHNPGGLPDEEYQDLMS